VSLWAKGMKLGRIHDLYRVSWRLVASPIACLSVVSATPPTGGHQRVPRLHPSRPRCSGAWAARRHPDALRTGCREHGSIAWRDRVLTPVTPVPVFRRQIRPGPAACSHRPPRSSVRFTAAAAGHARARRPRRVFARRWARFGSVVPRAAWDDGRGQGHRTWLGGGARRAAGSRAACGAAPPSDRSAWSRTSRPGGTRGSPGCSSPGTNGVSRWSRQSPEAHFMPFAGEPILSFH
jgi:hypothetical protein